VKKQHHIAHYLACFVTWLTTLAFCCQFLMVPEVWAALTHSPKTIRFRVPLWILQDGIPITPPLLQEDIAFFSDSDPLKIIRQTEPGSPTLLFLAFDLVGDLPTITPAKRAIINQIQELGPEYWVGLILARETLSVLQKPTRDKKLLQEKIEETRQIGKAGLLESIQSLADFSSSLMNRSTIRIGVILVTDSDVGNYRFNYLNSPINRSDSRDLSRRFPDRALQEEFIRISNAIVAYPVPLLVVHIDPKNDRMNRTYQEGLGQVANTMGGRLFLSKSPGDIARTLQEAFDWVTSFYVIDFEVPRRPVGLFKIKARFHSSLSPKTYLNYPVQLFFPAKN